MAIVPIAHITLSLCLLAATPPAPIALAQTHTAQPQAAQPQADDTPRVFESRIPNQYILWATPEPDEPLLPVQVNGYWGAMTTRGELALFPAYDWLDRAYDGRILAMLDQKYGYLDHAGRWAVEPQYDHADRFVSERALVRRGERVGFIDPRGGAVTPMHYNAALRFSEGHAAVRRVDLVGYIDLDGNTVIPPRFARARSFHEGLAAVALPGHHNSEEAPSPSTDPSPDTPNPAPDSAPAPAQPAAEPLRWAYLQPDGQLAFQDTAARFSALGDFHRGLAPARDRATGLWGFIDTTFDFAIEPTYLQVKGFAGRRAAVRTAQGWGYINPDGDLAVEPRYEDAGPFEDVFAAVRENGRWGYIDRRGGVRIAPQFAWVGPYRRGLAVVAHRDGFGYITVTAQPRWDPRLVPRGFLDTRPDSDTNGTLVPPPTPPNPRAADAADMLGPRFHPGHDTPPGQLPIPPADPDAAPLPPNP